VINFRNSSRIYKILWWKEDNTFKSRLTISNNNYKIDLPNPRSI